MSFFKILVVALAYVAFARLGFAFAPKGREVSALWPSTGSDLFFTLLWGPIAFPGIILGACISQLNLHMPLWVALGKGIVDMTESAIPYFLLLRLKVDFKLCTVRDIVLFCAAAFLGTFLDSVMGNTLFCLHGIEKWSTYFSHIPLWWSANFTGTIVLTPLMIAFWRGRKIENFRRLIELSTLLVVSAGFTLAIFLINSNGSINETEFLLLPLVAWSGLRLGIKGVSVVTVVISVIAVVGTCEGLGPYRDLSFENSLMVLQLFICVMGLTGHLLAASLFERQKAVIALQNSHSELEIKVEERTSELKEMALQDTLTGLPNRRWMLDHLRYALGRLQRNSQYSFGLLFLDLDRFKTVNDSLGHHAGDHLLKVVAERLKKVIREGDAVARLGGDEFTVFIIDFHSFSDAAPIIKIAERIIESLREPVILENHEIFVSTSIGIALSATGYDTPEEMLRDADTAMYRAKKSGIGKFEVFDPGMHQTAMIRLVMETDIRRAIARNEFILNYQSIVCFETGRLVGFEALIRWNHPERGLIPPGDFIPIAEETGLMLPIGTWVLREACEFMARWQQENTDASHLMISVNVSAIQLLQPDFAEIVASIIKETGLPGNRLKLELTESNLITHTEALTTTLDNLRLMGIELMIDDFGTGFSSLSYLAHLPMDALKVDRSFISGKHQTNESIEIVRCIVAMAKALGIHTVAEGVETAEQAAWVKEMSCDYAQGFYYSKPMTAAAAIELANTSMKSEQQNGDSIITAPCPDERQ